MVTGSSVAIVVRRYGPSLNVLRTKAGEIGRAVAGVTRPKEQSSSKSWVTQLRRDVALP